MAQRNSAAHAAKLTAAEANVALAVRHACAATARATHAARVAKATSVATVLAARIYVPTKALPYVHPVDVSAARNVVRLARAASLNVVLAMRAIRIADARIASAKASAAAVHATPTLVADVHTVPEEAFASWHRAFLAQVHAYMPCATKGLKGPTVGLSLEEKVMFKAMRLGARRGATKAKVVYTLNSAEVRNSITARDHARALGRVAQRAAEAALLAAMVHKHQATGLSIATIAARAAQGAAQREANATRKAGMPAKVARPHVIVVRSGPAKNKGAKRVHTPRVHTVESVAKQAADRAAVIASDMAFKVLMAKYKEDKAILRAKKAAQRKLWIELRAEKVARICAKLWMEKGVWVDRFLAEACNDACYEIRTSAMTELLALVGAAA